MNLLQLLKAAIYDMYKNSIPKNGGEKSQDVDDLPNFQLLKPLERKELVENGKEFRWKDTDGNEGVYCG